MTEKKPRAGTEAEMLARLSAMTDAIHKLRQEFLTSVRAQKPKRDRTTASDKPRDRKKH
jgi:hypothetical protein